MALQADTGLLVRYIADRDGWPSVDPINDWRVQVKPDGTVLFPAEHWNRVETQPTEGDLDAARLEAGYATWLAENGGDADATAKRAAREAIETPGVSLERLIEAFALVMMDEINLLRDQHSLANRTISQLKTAIKNKLA